MNNQDVQQAWEALPEEERNAVDAEAVKQLDEKGLTNGTERDCFIAGFRSGYVAER